MNSQLHVITVCTIVAILFFAIPFFLSPKFRVIKFFCWIIFALLSIFLFLMITARYDEKQHEKYLFGKYKIDIKNSIYHAINMSVYKSLTLTINNNYTFKFNDRKIPFLVSDSGNWLYWIDGDAEYIKFKFSKADTAYVTGKSNDDSFILNSNILKKGLNGDKISFQKER